MTGVNIGVGKMYQAMAAGHAPKSKMRRLLLCFMFSLEWRHIRVNSDNLL